MQVYQHVDRVVAAENAGEARQAIGCEWYPMVVKWARVGDCEIAEVVASEAGEPDLVIVPYKMRGTIDGWERFWNYDVAGAAEWAQHYNKRTWKPTRNVDAANAKPVLCARRGEVLKFATRGEASAFLEIYGFDRAIEAVDLNLQLSNSGARRLTPWDFSTLNLVKEA